MPDKNLLRLNGRTALVTGAAGGIGLAIVQRLVAEGCRVMMTDVDRERLMAAEASVSGAGEAEAMAADLSSHEARAQLVPAVLERWGRIDILVNNAADHGARKPFLETDDVEMERILGVNVVAAASLARAAARDMVTRGTGAIIGIGSIQAELPVPSYAAYVASKGGVAGLTRALAVELSHLGIRVNTVLPGVIATRSFYGTLGQSHADRPQTAALLGREGSAEEVAAAVAFLASDEASFITGALLPVDGGRSLSRRADPFQEAFGQQAHSGKIA